MSLSGFLGQFTGNTINNGQQQVLQSAPVPPGWRAEFSPQFNRFFYIDNTTGQRQWEPPVHRQPPPVAYAIPNTPELPHQPPQLPPGWIAQFSNEHNRNFFVNTATGTSQWTVPSPDFAPPPNTFAPSPHFSPPNQATSLSSSHLVHPEDTDPSASIMPATASPFRHQTNHLTPSAAQAAHKSQQQQLPPGWIATYNHREQRFSYTNTATGQVTWMQPTSAASAPMSLPPHLRPKKIETFESAESEKARLHSQEYRPELNDTEAIMSAVPTHAVGPPSSNSSSSIAGAHPTPSTREPDGWETVPGAPPPAYEPFDAKALQEGSKGQGR
ncbi:hypothetical protein BJ741DRAFT_617908 [Chytriomyces cf. hyalinus JEL632]|nr:hypothetical protein BJ741DRAFT_617908 [Chytriomyces cf. hyalinus JEL632]